MPVYKIWSLGSTEFEIEEGSSVEEACKKAGKKRQDCEVQLIPEEQIIRPGARPPRHQRHLWSLPSIS